MKIFYNSSSGLDCEDAKEAIFPYLERVDLAFFIIRKAKFCDENTCKFNCKCVNWCESKFQKELTLINVQFEAIMKVINSKIYKLELHQKFDEQLIAANVEDLMQIINYVHVHSIEEQKHIMKKCKENLMEFVYKPIKNNRWCFREIDTIDMVNFLGITPLQQQQLDHRIQLNAQDSENQKKRKLNAFDLDDLLQQKLSLSNKKMTVVNISQKHQEEQ